MTAIKALAIKAPAPHGLGIRTAPHRCTKALPARRNLVKAERSNGFSSGVLLGGLAGVAIGWLFAPQISSALARVAENSVDDDNSNDNGRNGVLAANRENLDSRIAQLNDSIDLLTAKLNTNKEQENEEFKAA